MPDLLDLLVHKVRQARVDVARGDAVDAREVAPLVREGLRQVDAACFGDVVGGLLLGVVGDVACWRAGGGVSGGFLGEGVGGGRVYGGFGWGFESGICFVTCRVVHGRETGLGICAYHSSRL